MCQCVYVQFSPVVPSLKLTPLTEKSEEFLDPLNNET